MANIHFYVMRFRDGTVKAGISKNAKQRKYQISSVDGLGMPLETVIIKTDRAASVERYVIAKLADRCVKGREYFQGVAVQEVVSLAREAMANGGAHDSPFRRWLDGHGLTMGEAAKLFGKTTRMLEYYMDGSREISFTTRCLMTVYDENGCVNVLPYGHK